MKKGFTLVELLIAATIIALLAGIGVGSYNTLTKQSRDTRRKADLENMRAALEFYRSQNSSYPSALSVLSPDYLKSVLDDPKANLDYFYCPITVNNVRVNYYLCAYMETGGSPNGTNCGFSCNGNCGSQTCNYKLTPLGEE